MPVWERWMLGDQPKQETLALMDVIEKLSERHGCPVWVSNDFQLTPLSVMSERFMRNAYGYAVGALDRAEQWVRYYQGEIDRALEYVELGVRVSYVLRDGQGHDTGTQISNINMISDARSCLASWQRGVTQLACSVEALRAEAAKRSIDLSYVPIKYERIEPFRELA